VRALAQWVLEDVANFGEEGGGTSLREKVKDSSPIEKGYQAVSTTSITTKRLVLSL